MTLTDINKILSQIAEQKTRGKIIEFSFELMQWMGITPNAGNKPQLLATQTQKLKEYLVNAPQTVLSQLYRLSADGQNIRVRFAVLKKLKKEYINQLVDNDPGLTTYQASVKGIVNIQGRPQYIPSQPYYIHFVTTPEYDKLVLIFNQGEQKRILVFRKRLSQTQFIKILPAWQNIAGRTKPEIAQQFWNSLDVKEVNKEFYKHIKEQFDSLIEIAKSQNKDFDEIITKQFAVRLIGRYIFCWFLKEKEIIPQALVSSDTIEKFKDSYFQSLLSKLFFKTLNAEVTDLARIETITPLDELYKNIPYLNGGLFDRHPEDVLFDILDLNEWLAGFVKVLESFDFTVDESSSQYQHVAIDPEMLGLIFENLLASQNPDTEKMANQRKAFGAFYTPREIVDYMVNESLKAFVETQLLPQFPEQTDKVSEPSVKIKGTLFQDIVDEPKPTPYNKTEIAEMEHLRERLKIKIDKLFAPDCTENPFDKDETVRLRKAISEITVLDPACGSGAFPMGVMLRLMEIRQIIGHGHRNNYDLKEEILSKNIFGVDIMPMAVEIARLRAWLSLVLESDYKPTDRKNNFDIAALPNLDFKFVCANSLIDSGYDAFLEKSHHNATLYRLDGEIQKLEKLRNSYFDPQGDKNKKEELQKEFLKTKDYIKTGFKSLKKSWNLEDFLSKVDDWNPFDDSKPSSFFSPAWMFGIRNGFDVVIGNPPYVFTRDADFSDDFKKYISKKYFSLLISVNKKTKSNQSGKINLFALFALKGILDLNKKGTLALIVPNNLLRTTTYDLIRKFLLENSKIEELVDLGSKIFNEVTASTIIIRLSNDKLNHNHKTKIISEIKDLESKDYRLSYIEQSQFMKNVSYTLNLYMDNRLNNLLNNISVDIKPLGDFCKDIIEGVVAHKYLIETTKSESNKALIEGKSIKRYNQCKPNKYIIWDKEKIHRTRPDYLWRAQKKIIIQRISGGENPLTATIDKEKYLTFASVNNLLLKNEFENSYEYILALLNSRFLNWYYANNFSNNSELTVNISKTFLEKLPIPNIPFARQKPFIDLVEKVISSKKENLNTTDLEKEIDVMVYKLYELNYDEVKIIDKDFWLSEEEYNAIEL
ncbi:MAG: TaqI-like C-terminal specificity domain-containing protein [Bacteroidota bacterium]